MGPLHILVSAGPRFWCLPVGGCPSDTAVQPRVFSGFPLKGPGLGAGALSVHAFRRCRMGPLDISVLTGAKFGD